MAYKHSYNKKTFEQQQNIAFTKQTYMRDVLDLNPQNWTFLYQQMKSRGLNLKEIRKNISKYDQNVHSLIESSQNYYFDKVTNSRVSMKQKINEYNNQLRIRLGELFDYIGLLHLEELSMGIQFMYESLVGTVEQMIDSIEQLKQSNYRLQKELQDWKLKKKNVLCFSCRQNVQQAKLRNLTISMGQTTTTSEQPHELIDQQHKVKKIQSQCRALQMQLNAMSEQNFFNSQSDHLIQLINEALRTKILLGDNKQKQENTVTLIGNCLNDLSELAKPLEIDYAPLLSGKHIHSSKKLGSVSKPLSLKDLNDNGQFLNKLKLLFQQPIHRFVQKYQQIIIAKCATTPIVVSDPTIQRKEQQTQTTLQKQPQVMKNYEKQITTLHKQLNLLKTSKQKSDKQILRVLDLLQKNESKVIEIVAKNRLLEVENNDFTTENKGLRQKLKKLEEQVETEKETLFRNFTHQKSGMQKQMAVLEEEVRQFRQDQFQKTMRFKLETKGVQTFNTSLSYNKDYTDAQAQTNQVPGSIDMMKSTKKSFFKTLKSIKLQSKPINEEYQNVDHFSMSSTTNVMVTKKQHGKSRSQIPSVTGRNLASSKRLLKDDMEMLLNSRADMMVRTSPIDENLFTGMTAADSPLAKHPSKESIKKIFAMKKNRKPSINSMVPESRQNSKSYLTSSKFFSQQKHEDQSLRNQQQSNRGIKQDKGLTQRLVSGTSALQISGLVKSHKYHHSSVSPNASIKMATNQQLSLADSNMQSCNFYDISNILASNGESRGFLVSKLKKMPKTQVQDLMRTNPSINKKKVVIRSQLQTQRDQHEDLNAQKYQKHYDAIDKSINPKTYKEINYQNQPLQYEVQAGNSQGAEQFTRNMKLQNRKQYFLQQIQQRFQYFSNIGLISLFEQIDKPFERESTAENHKQNHQKMQNLSKPPNSQPPSPKRYIHKSDLSLFFSIEEASKYESCTGLWNELQSCIMVDNNFSKLTDQVDRYFEYLKHHQKTVYNECVLFLREPSRFFKDILDEKSGWGQRGRVLKEVAKVGAQIEDFVDKNGVKDVFRKLIRLHKAVHRNGCRHVEDFLKKIGFYEFVKRQINSQMAEGFCRGPKTSHSPSRVINL